MTPLGLRPRLDCPKTYRGFRLYRLHGRVYAVPPSVDLWEIHKQSKLLWHPAVLSAATLEEMQQRIDRGQDNVAPPDRIGTCADYDLVRFRARVYGVPQAAGWVDLDVAEERRRAGVLQGATTEEVRQRIAQARETVPVEFAGWLPIFEFSGNCGRHPQFTQTTEPPAGYRFTCSAPPRRRGPSLRERVVTDLGPHLVRLARSVWRGVRPFIGLLRPGPKVSVRARFRVVLAMLRLFVAARRQGARLLPFLRFVQSRHFQSQLLLAQPHRLVFLTSMPYTYGQNPWLIEIEDPTTLFYPMVVNGWTGNQRLDQSPYFPIVKALLASDPCRGIVTHMRSTAALVGTLFDSDAIRAKISYTPLGVALPQRWQRHETHAPFEPLNLLFINSWCQARDNFFVRGGLDVLEAFALLRKRYPHLRLTLRVDLPELDPHYHRLIESGWVRVIDRFLPAEEMDGLLAESHLFLLPAARVHIVSLLQAMSYGLAVVTSDGWGIEEYVEHQRNGLIVPGRYGKVSWADEPAGTLREDYSLMYTSDARVVHGLVEAVARLVEDHELRRRLGRTARHDVETRYSLASWNEGLRQALDRALKGAQDSVEVSHGD